MPRFCTSRRTPAGATGIGYVAGSGLQKLADETRLTIHVSHLPPGTSKWNKVEHRLFCHITANWRGTPLTTYETIVDRIGNTRTEAGLQVQAELDTGQYPTGVTVTTAEMDAIALFPMSFTATGTTSSSLDEVGNSISIAVLRVRAKITS